jgi:hypothetical protein
MKWECVYCHKIMDKDNFREFIKDSDNKDAELHGWQLMPMPEAESAATIATEIKLMDAFKHR